MLLYFAAVLLILGAIYGWLDHVARRREQEEAQAKAPHPTYACRQCGQRVDMTTTVRPIRLTLLCLDHYRSQYGTLPPPPGPKQRRRGRPYRERGPISIPTFPRR